MDTDYLCSRIHPKLTGLSPRVVVYVIESKDGKQRLYVPGRRTPPHLVAQLHEKIIAFSLRAVLALGEHVERWSLSPRTVVGVTIFTEGLGAPFTRAFAKVWPDEAVGGVCAAWSKRRVLQKKALPETSYTLYAARVIHFDDTALRYLPSNEGTLVFFDIGATGSTMRATVPQIVASANGKVTKAIFASPCTSLYAIKAFVEAATESGLKEENLAVVANEGIFGLGKDGTALSLRLPGAIASSGNLKLSETVYPNPEFCHIGAGGLAATCYPAYLEELIQDEEEWGKLPNFGSLKEAMEQAGVSWPDDFGRINRKK